MDKILCYIDSLGAGGAQRQLVGLAKELSTKGYDVTICVYADIPFYVHEIKDTNIRYKYLSKAQNKFLKLFYTYKYIKELKPDCVISFLEMPSIIMCIIKIVLKKFKLIVSERNTTQKITRLDRMRFYLFKQADYIVSNSYTQDKFIKRNFPFLSNKCLPIINFVDTEKFNMVKHEMSDLVKFIVAASISPSKNTLNFIQSIKDVINEGYTNFEVNWYGIVDHNDTYYIQCEKVITENNLSKFIKLLPKTIDICQKYHESDFFCLPSIYEGTPNALTEALSCGIPSICSDVSDNSHYVIDSYNGFLFNPKSSASMASAIIKCLELRTEEYLLFAQRSRATAVEQFNINKFANSYINLISDCL